MKKISIFILLTSLTIILQADLPKGEILRSEKCYEEGLIPDKYVDKSDAAGYTALMNAVSSGDSALVQKLIDCGANVKKANSYTGQTPLMFAAARNLEIARYLIEKGADTNAADSEGFTPLMIATLEDKPKVVTLLLDKGANPSLVNKKGKTALDLTSIRINRWTKVERPGIARLLENYIEKEKISS